MKLSRRPRPSLAGNKKHLGGVTHSAQGLTETGHPPGGPTLRASAALTMRVKLEVPAAIKNAGEERTVESSAGLPGKDTEYAARKSFP